MEGDERLGKQALQLDLNPDFTSFSDLIFPKYECQF
jgi:hypothetical protein